MKTPTVKKINTWRYEDDRYEFLLGRVLVLQVRRVRDNVDDAGCSWSADIDTGYAAGASLQLWFRNGFTSREDAHKAVVAEAHQMLKEARKAWKRK